MRMAVALVLLAEIAHGDFGRHQLR